MLATGFKVSVKGFIAALSLLCACAAAQSISASDLTNTIANASIYPKALELRPTVPPSVGETQIYAQLLKAPAHQPIYLPQAMVDRSVLVNVLREGNALPIIRLWGSTRAHLYVGVGPNGLAGLNFSQKRKIADKKKKRAEAKDYSTRIRELTAARPDR